MLSDVAEFVVQGITLEGEIFEPSDWAERLQDSVSAVGPSGGMDCSAYVRSVVSEGDVSLVVRIALKDVNHQAFDLIKKYISDNGLMVRAGRGSRSAEGVGNPLPVARERRDPGRNKW